MPASGFDCYLQDARNNLESVRPAPIPTDSVLLGQSQIHISTNCYYGYHGMKNAENVNISTDSEMMEVGDPHRSPAGQTTARKRSADATQFLQNKRPRKEVQRENIEPETNETIKSETKAEDLLESLYWNIHGGNDSSICSLVGTRSSPSHSASAFNAQRLPFTHRSVQFALQTSITVT